MGSAQPRRHTVAQAFVQNILENTGECRDGNQRGAIVLTRYRIGGHRAFHITAAHLSQTLIRLDCGEKTSIKADSACPADCARLTVNLEVIHRREIGLERSG
jgi:hypothetical protein